MRNLYTVEPHSQVTMWADDIVADVYANDNHLTVLERFRWYWFDAGSRGSISPFVLGVKRAKKVSR